MFTCLGRRSRVFVRRRVGGLTRLAIPVNVSPQRNILLSFTNRIQVVFLTKASIFKGRFSACRRSWMETVAGGTTAASPNLTHIEDTYFPSAFFNQSGRFVAPSASQTVTLHCISAVSRCSVITFSSSQTFSKSPQPSGLELPYNSCLNSL